MSMCFWFLRLLSTASGFIETTVTTTPSTTTAEELKLSNLALLLRLFQQRRLSPNKVSSPILAEWDALLVGLRKAEELKLSNLLVRTDSMSLATFVQGKSPVPRFLVSFVRDISCRRWCSVFSQSVIG